MYRKGDLSSILMVLHLRPKRPEAASPNLSTSIREYFVGSAIRFRPIKPASPHLNGKVERSQRTDLDEFYPTVDPKSPDHQLRLEEWQDHYNQYRPHGSLQDDLKERTVRVFRSLRWCSAL